MNLILAVTPEPLLPPVYRKFTHKVDSGLWVKDRFTCFASILLLAQVEHCLSEWKQEGKGSVMTYRGCPSSQETFPLHVSSLQGLVNSHQGGISKFSVLKFSAASPPQTWSATPQCLRHTNSLQCPQYCFDGVINSPLRDSFQRQIVWIASKAQQRLCSQEHLKTRTVENNWCRERQAGTLYVEIIYELKF